MAPKFCGFKIQQKNQKVGILLKKAFCLKSISFLQKSEEKVCVIKTNLF